MIKNMTSKIKNHIYALLFFVGAFFCVSVADAAWTTPPTIHSVSGSWGSADYTNDGLTYTGDSYLREVPNASVIYDLGSSQHITEAQLYAYLMNHDAFGDPTGLEMEGVAESGPIYVNIYVSDDPSNFPAVPVVEDWIVYYSGDYVTSPTFDAIGRYVRFDFDDGGGIGFVQDQQYSTYTRGPYSKYGWMEMGLSNYCQTVLSYEDYESIVNYGYSGTPIYNVNYYCVMQTAYTTTSTASYDPRINEVLLNYDEIPAGGVPVDINVEVQETLSLDCHDIMGTTGDYDVQLGTASDPGRVTAGTPAVGGSTCDVTTNDDQGYFLTLIDDNGVANTVLTHDDPNTAAVYQIADLAQYSFASPDTQKWSAPVTKGLGFSVIRFPDSDMTNNNFDGVWTTSGDLCEEGIGSDQADYAGIPDTAEAIAAVTQYEANLTTTDVCYKVDVPSSQASGEYTGSVTYTATSDAGAYYN